MKQAIELEKTISEKKAELATKVEQSNYYVRFDNGESNDKCYVNNELELSYEPTLMTKGDAQQLASDFEASLDMDIWGGSLRRGIAKIIVEKL